MAKLISREEYEQTKKNSPPTETKIQKSLQLLTEIFNGKLRESKQFVSVANFMHQPLEARNQFIDSLRKSGWNVIYTPVEFQTLTNDDWDQIHTDSPLEYWSMRSWSEKPGQTFLVRL